MILSHFAFLIVAFCIILVGQYLEFILEIQTMVASQATTKYAELLSSLEKLNNRLGISHLTATETTIFLAIANNDLSENVPATLTDLVFSNPEIRSIPRATLFRCLRTLAEKSLIKHIGNKRSGKYRLA